ncbi:GNAT family N-acetyltransferase [Angustibacter aerolatus]
MRTAPSLRPLERSDRDAVLELCAADGTANVMVAERIEQVGGDPARMGGHLWGLFERGRLTSACWAGANLIPVQVRGDAALDAFASRARRSGGSYSSLFGEADAVLGMWRRLEQAGWWAREVRASQPLYATSSPSRAVEPDPLVHRAGPDDLAVVLPASVAMFTEEVGYSPIGSDGGTSYRRRVAELLRQGRTFVRRDVDGSIVFKADLGAVGGGVAQVHGVWVAPRHRGTGLAAPAMAAVVAQTLQREAPVVSLYVNDFNERALATYRRVGFERVGTFATVLF